MKTMGLIGLMGLMIAATATAKIGANAAECAKIYGDPVEADLTGIRTIYKKGGIEITCRFIDGVCAAVSYDLAKSSTVIHPKSGNDLRFTHDQEAMLLNLNRAGSSWIQSSKASYAPKGDGVYASADGKLQALVNFVAVNIETVEYHRLRTAAASKAEIDKTISTFGDGATVDPKPAEREFPLSKEEQADLDMKRNLEELTKRTKELSDGLKGGAAK